MNDAPILLCYDGSDDAEQAIRRAAVLFGARPAVVLTAWQPAVVTYSYRWPGIAAAPDFEHVDAASDANAQRLAAQGAAIARDAGLDAQPVAVRALGAIRDAVINAAEEFHAGAIVLGSRGLGKTKSVLFGSVSSGVVHHATRPVLVVRRACVSGDGPVVIAYDGSPDAALAIECAAALCAGRDALVATVQQQAQMALAQPWPGTAFDSEIEHLDRATLEAAQACAIEGVGLASAAGLRAQPLVCPATGAVWQTILGAADEADAGVVVLGSRGFGEFESLLRGSVSDAAVRHAHRPLLVVRHGAGS